MGWAFGKTLKRDRRISLRTSIRIGNGRHVSFWRDIWVRDSKLKDVFPTLFKIAAHKFASVADLWRRQGVGGGC